MKSLHVAVLVFMSAITTLAQTTPAGRLQAPKPNYVADVLVVVPGDMQRLFERSAIVARVRITSSSAVIIDRPGKLGPTVRTKHTAAVVALYKGSGQPRTVEFYQTAGSAETERYKVRIADQKVLVPGREYVIFLAPYRFLNSYSLVGEDNGAFEITDSKIRAVGVAEISRAHDNMPIDKFLAELRAIDRRVSR
ncbi:MAG TPA: hypothetical protein VHU41_10990 [Thermoanaerobaculia bacterium]|nr:hypothetical protein [Thermoanaerobaculia bacterium]